MTNWLKYRVDPQRVGGIFAYQLYSCKGWKWLTALVKSQGQGGPPSVSFALLFVGRCYEKYIFPSSQTLT